LDNFETKQGVRVGIVGMGTATALVYGRKGDTYRIYEINPQIIEFSKKYFTYQDDFIARGGQLDIVQGDARLNLEREPDQHYDVLLLDAFSGDSVPVHLLTVEAFKIYMRHMNVDGIIAVHVTNRYLSLAPVIEKIAKQIGMKTTRIQTDSNGDHDITDYVLVTNNDPFLIATPPESPWDADEPLNVDAWDRHAAQSF
jgi:spermidine synthase